MGCSADICYATSFFTIHTGTVLNFSFLRLESYLLTTENCLVVLSCSIRSCLHCESRQNRQHKITRWDIVNRHYGFVFVLSDFSILKKLIHLDKGAHKQIIVNCVTYFKWMCTAALLWEKDSPFWPKISTICSEIIHEWFQNDLPLNTNLYMLTKHLFWIN